MSNSSLVTYTQISPNKNSPRNHKIDTITIHHAASVCTVEQIGAIFAPATRGGSSNYGVDAKGHVGLYVSENDRAWTSSSRTNDNRAVTIEVANDGGSPDWHVSDVALNKTIELVADICKRNGITKLIWGSTKAERINHLNGCNMTVHQDFAATACPGPYLLSKMPYIAEQVNKLLGANGSSTTTTSSTSTSTASAAVAAYSSYTQTDFIKELQAAIGTTVDGIAGPKTLAATVTISRRKNTRHAAVRPIQKYLNSLGFDCGTVDGIAGAKFDTAVKAYQKSIGGTVDGELTAGGFSYKKLLGLA